MENIFRCPHPESNQDLFLRTELLYPLSYGGNVGKHSTYWENQRSLLYSSLVMETEEKDKLDELLDLTRENNKILRSMHRRQVWGQILTVFYWLVILGIAGWAYVYFQPYIEQYMSAYKTITAALEGIEEKGRALPSLSDILPRER